MCRQENYFCFFKEYVEHCITAEGFVTVKSCAVRRAYSECCSNFIARLPVLQLLLHFYM
jgi:hypothetical protein